MLQLGLLRGFARDRGPVDVSLAVLLDAQVLLVDEDAHDGSDTGIGGWVAHGIAHFAGGSVSEGVDDVEDFFLALGEGGSRGGHG